MREKVLRAGVFAVIFLIGIFAMRSFKTENSAAKIFIEREKITAEFLDALNFPAQNFEKFLEITGDKKFAITASGFQKIYDLNFTPAENGVLFSFSATGGTDVLHPFFGFLKISETGAAEIFWAKNPRGEITDSGGGFLEIENSTDFPWPCGKNWKDFQTGAAAVLKCDARQNFVGKNERGVFEFPTEIAAEKFSPQNSTHFFFIEI